MLLPDWWPPKAAPSRSRVRRPFTFQIHRFKIARKARSASPIRSAQLNRDNRERAQRLCRAANQDS